MKTKTLKELTDEGFKKVSAIPALMAWTDCKRAQIYRAVTDEEDVFILEYTGSYEKVKPIFMEVLNT